MVKKKKSLIPVGVQYQSRLMHCSVALQTNKTNALLREVCFLLQLGLANRASIGITVVKSTMISGSLG